MLLESKVSELFLRLSLDAAHNGVLCLLSLFRKNLEGEILANLKYLILFFPESIVVFLKFNPYPLIEVNDLLVQILSGFMNIGGVALQPLLERTHISKTAGQQKNRQFYSLPGIQIDEVVGLDRAKDVVENKLRFQASQVHLLAFLKILLVSSIFHLINFSSVITIKSR